MAERWTERLTTELARTAPRVDHNEEHHAIATFLKRKTRPNTEARFPLAIFVRILRGWGDCPVRHSTLIDVLEARGFSVRGLEPRYVYGLEMLPPGEENEQSPGARKYTADDWHTFCDALRALTVDDHAHDGLSAGILLCVVRRWAHENGREFQPSIGAMCALIRQAGYEVYNLPTRTQSGKTRQRRYIRGLRFL
ncbi:hypothetical protein ACWCQB_26560 [Streptomyces hirsutus]